jgi:antitoxin component YwqK of YwqJK toxin-antitoxin module
MKKKNGKGKEYYFNGKLKFEGEYLNGERWIGIGYDGKGNITFQLKNGTGKVKEYQGYDGDELKFDGEYLNGKKHGKGKEYSISQETNSWDDYSTTNFFYFLSFEGEYLNGKRHGKGKEYHDNKRLKFEGNYVNGERWNGI